MTRRRHFPSRRRWQVLIAGGHGERDRKLTVLNAERFAIVGQSVQMVLRVDDFGGGSGGSAEISLSVDGKPLGNRVVPVGQDTSLKVPVTHEGENIVEIAAAPGTVGTDLAEQPRRGHRLLACATGCACC